MAKQPINFFARGLGVFNRVVQKRCNNRRVIKLQLGEDGGHFKRVGNIGRARGPLLAAMRAHRIHIGAVKQRLVRVRIIGLYPINKLVLPHHASNYQTFRTYSQVDGQIEAKTLKKPHKKTRLTGSRV